ncbi:Hint domain-containing protein [Pacificibacter sp. AS14]|uniref:Hint domain-containing protein n=1 Tax=Pacificibacter sp. AS14 TaxID=3135785 RepID=UPI00316D6100
MAKIYGDSGDNEIDGTSGEDTIKGYSGDDTIDGGGGNDDIYGGDGDDTIYGGDGNDDISGGDGDDTIYGGDGRDEIEGNDGDDTLYGGDGRDEIDGGDGDDYIDGGDGDDEIEGRDGDDTIYGGDGDDDIEGNDGDDYIDGGDGDDVIDGGSGDDTIYGGDGDDDIEGGSGDDTIYLDGGDDTVDGEKGDDTFIIAASSDSTIEGGEDSDGDDVDVIQLSRSDYDYADYTVAYDKDDSESGTIYLYDDDGELTGTITFSEIESIVCFTPGTAIATPQGEVGAETLKEGDKVFTRDNGVQEIRWVGQKDVTELDFACQESLAPVLIQKGALGNGLPQRDLMVSPQHRVLLNSERAQLYFEEREVLAPAVHLVGMPGISRARPARTSYVHFMCDNHEVVLSNGAWTETFQPGEASLKGLQSAQRDEVFSLFPELATKDGLTDYESARKSLKKHETRLLFAS